MIFVTADIYSQVLQTPTARFSLIKIAPDSMPYPLSAVATSPKIFTPPVFLSPSYYAAHLGFFCKQEIKLEKTAKIPFKFRLGSVEDCDRMEGKRKMP